MIFIQSIILLKLNSTIHRQWKLKFTFFFVSTCIGVYLNNQQIDNYAITEMGKLLFYFTTDEHKYKNENKIVLDNYYQVSIIDDDIMKFYLNSKSETKKIIFVSINKNV